MCLLPAEQTQMAPSTERAKQMGGRDARMAEWVGRLMSGWTEGWEGRWLCVSGEGGWLVGRAGEGITEGRNYLPSFLMSNRI